ncbi:hypothetical protein BKA57DRAFT_446632 [Linnemannia elongata]|nr:hypothetical protein BKA57DRAFT_446632 [Linnemannia elongata]
MIYLGSAALSFNSFSSASLVLLTHSPLSFSFFLSPLPFSTSASLRQLKEEKTTPCSSPLFFYLFHSSFSSYKAHGTMKCLIKGTYLEQLHRLRVSFL